MKCKHCKVEFEPKRSTARYCSPKCRKLAFQETQVEVSVPRTITDACGTVHPIDFEGRRKDYELLESWAKGEGTKYQQHLGRLARHYRPLDFIVTSYLGMT